MNMNRTLWTKVYPIFKPEENWGDSTMVKADLVFLLYFLRVEMGVPFVLHCAYDLSGHSTDPPSQHFYGKAADGHYVGMTFKQCVDKLQDILHTKTIGDVRKHYALFMQGKDDDILLGDVIGFGIYPDWLPAGGVHLDVRGYKARWGAYNKVIGRDADGKPRVKQTYVCFEEAYTRIVAKTPLPGAPTQVHAGQKHKK